MVKKHMRRDRHVFIVGIERKREERTLGGKSVSDILRDAGARKKLEEIYVCYRRDMFVTAYSILKDYQEAEDVVQAAILRISGCLEKFSEIKCRKTRSFLVIIVRNLCFNIYNEKKKVEYIPEYDAVEDDDELSIEDYLMRLEESDVIANKLAALHRPYADILALRYYHELSGPEIARLLGISEKNVGVRLHRAIKALRGILEERGDGLEESTKGRRETEREAQ